jgi:predicted DNA-binding transcriptional regulator YafY
MNLSRRQLCLLQLLPDAPKRIDCATLCGRLRARGFDGDERTLQRELVSMARELPLVSDDVNRPRGWSWAHGAAPLRAAMFDPLVALGLAFVDEAFVASLPAATREELNALRAVARRVLEAYDETGPGILARRVRVEALPSPPGGSEALEVVAGALLAGARIAVQRATRPSKLDPLGLVWRDGAVWLVARGAPAEAPVAIPIRSVKRVRHLDEPADRSGFDLDAFLGACGLGGDGVDLVARVRRAARAAVEAVPLAPGQTLEPARPGELRLRARVVDDEALRARLLGWGDDVLVEAPATLAEALADTARRVSARYRNATRPRRGVAKAREPAAPESGGPRAP